MENIISAEKKKKKKITCMQWTNPIFEHNFQFWAFIVASNE